MRLMEIWFQNYRHEYEVGPALPSFATVTASTLLRGLSIRFWSASVGICAHLEGRQYRSQLLMLVEKTCFCSSCCKRCSIGLRSCQLIGGLSKYFWPYSVVTFQDRLLVLAKWSPLSGRWWELGAGRSSDWLFRFCPQLRTRGTDSPVQRKWRRLESIPCVLLFLFSCIKFTRIWSLWS